MRYLSAYLFRKLTNIVPTVSKRGDVLVISYGWRSHLLSLGSVSRRIEVDPNLKVLHIIGRRFWVFGWSKRIEFDWVEVILYGYWNSGWALGTGASGWGVVGFGEYTEEEMFTIALQLKNNTKVVLCRFFGSGEWVNNSFLPDWCYWGDQMLADATYGSQQSSSSTLVNVLSNLIGVPVVNPTP